MMRKSSPLLHGRVLQGEGEGGKKSNQPCTGSVPAQPPAPWLSHRAVVLPPLIPSVVPEDTRNRHQ